MAVNNISDYALGKLVQIDFASNVRYQLSTRVKDFDNMLKKSVGDLGGARHHEFALQTSGGPNATQAQRADGATAEFPEGQLSDVGFYEAVYKEMDTTIELSISMWNKAKAEPDKYAEPLMLESKSKALTSRREMCIYLYGDGTGRRLEVASSAAASNNLVLTASTAESAIGHPGWLQHGELIYIMEPAATITSGTPSAVRVATTSSGTANYYKVVGRDLRKNTVTVEAYDASGSKLIVTGSGTVAAGDTVYKKGQLTAVATDSSITEDFNLITEVAAGYESIAAGDGRKVHGVTMSGATAGTNRSVSGAFDPQHIQEGVTDVKTITGDEYIYNQILMAPKVKDLFVESLESDKYFRGDDPKGRGGKGFFYQHDDSMMQLVSSEFCPANRIWAIPDSESKDEQPCEFRGQDFQMVNVDGNETFLATGSAGRYRRSIQKFMNGRFCFLSKHPASILKISGYDAV